jgi:hypothetical protein
MDSNKLKVILVLGFATFAAVYLGIAAATAQFEAVLWVVGGVGLSICLALGKKIWLLLPIATSIGLKLPLPGNFSTIFMTQAVVLGFCGLLFLMRRLPLNFRFTELEGWCLLFLIFVAQAYMRNPVGLNIFGSDTVGGKPYAVLALTVLTAILLASLRNEPNDLKWWVRLTMIGSIANFGFGLLAKFLPTSLAIYLGASFSNDVEIEDPSDRTVVDEDAAGRVTFVRNITKDLAIWISSRISPLKAVFHPIWAPLVLFTLAGAAFSGFRSQFAFVGLAYFVGVCYRGGFSHVMISALIGAVSLVILALGNMIYPLPPNIQRALTFLPGTWEQRHKDSAKISTDWRTEIWITALTSEKYIRNKILGDGLGMTSSQLQQTLALNDTRGGGISGFDLHREAILISGDYHSGPVQTIRTCGYLGLLVLLCGMVRVAVHAHRQILRSRGTEWYPTVLFICIPFISLPFSWVFIFGTFNGGAYGLLMGTALVRMLEKNLPIPSYVRKRDIPYVPLVSPTRSGPISAKN